MSKANDNLVEKNYLFWLFIYLIIVIMSSLILSFPKSLVVSLIVIFCLNIIRAQIAFRKAGMRGIKPWYKSSSSSGFSRGSRTNLNGYPYNTLKFYCMNCGNEHNKIACPKCGSKAVRAV